MILNLALLVPGWVGPYGEIIGQGQGRRQLYGAGSWVPGPCRGASGSGVALDQGRAHSGHVVCHVLGDVAGKDLVAEAVEVATGVDIEGLLGVLEGKAGVEEGDAFRR